MDKILYYENIIQAFREPTDCLALISPFGTIRYYRKPHTMERNINAAVKLYSGDKPLGLFVPRLAENLQEMNKIYAEITELFAEAVVENFERLPKETAACRKFAKLFKEFNDYLEAAKIQGFKWEQTTYLNADTGEVIEMTVDEKNYLVLVLRYKELFVGSDDDHNGG